jgi:hypothetical protein
VTIFDYLKDIVVDKKGDLPLEQYVPFLVGRWLSFLNPTVATAVNELNKQVFIENRELHYKTMLTLFPKMQRMPRINYIKKVKEDQQEEDKCITLLAEKHELGKKEIRELISEL